MMATRYVFNLADLSLSFHYHIHYTKKKKKFSFWRYTKQMLQNFFSRIFNLTPFFISEASKLSSFTYLFSVHCCSTMHIKRVLFLIGALKNKTFNIQTNSTAAFNLSIITFFILNEKNSILYHNYSYLVKTLYVKT